MPTSSDAPAYSPHRRTQHSGRTGAEPNDRIRRRRILFVAEALTLAQVVRLAALANSLDSTRYDVHFACGEFDSIAFSGTGLRPIPLHTIERHRALRRAERGERLYEEKGLIRYVEEELRLLDDVRPDFIVGDLRLSLPISARLTGVPYAALINAYFSPYAERDGFPLPDHPIVSLLGVARAARYFPRALPAVFAHFVAPINSVRKRYGLEPLAGLPEALCAGDFTLYPDVPELCPTARLPAHHRYLGPVLWSPELPLPAFWGKWDGHRPLVYITLGSSGRLSVLRTVLRAIAELPVIGVLATAGRFELDDPPPNVHVARYLPGAIVARAADCVVTNGGASTSYQALAEGRPVLGIPSNLDQYLAMTAIERAGAGRLVRSGEITEATVKKGLDELIHCDELRAGATAVAGAFARASAEQRFGQLLNEVFGDVLAAPLCRVPALTTGGTA